MLCVRPLGGSPNRRQANEWLHAFFMSNSKKFMKYYMSISSIKFSKTYWGISKNGNEALQNQKLFRIAFLLSVLVAMIFPDKGFCQGIRFESYNIEYQNPINEKVVTSSNGGIEYHTTKLISDNGVVNNITPPKQSTYYLRFSGNYIYINQSTQEDPYVKEATTFQYDHSENGKSLYYDIRRFTNAPTRIRYWMALIVSPDKATINYMWLNDNRETTNGYVLKKGPKEKSRIEMYE